jgi:hypothetical protein
MILSAAVAISAVEGDELEEDSETMGNWARGTEQLSIVGRFYR